MKNGNKVALVLGSIKGIGKGIGLALAKEGFNVALNYFDWEEMLDELKHDFSEIDSKHIITRTDLLKTNEIQGVVDKVTQSGIRSVELCGGHAPAGRENLSTYLHGYYGYVSNNV